MPVVSFIIELTRRDFAERFAGSWLGSLWAFIWPIVHLFIYTVIFGKLMGARLSGTSGTFTYGIYLASGLLAWTTFSQIVNRCAGIFIEKKQLISKIKLSLPTLLLAVVAAETVTYVISMVFFFIFLLVAHHPLNPHLILLPFVYLLMVAFALGLGLITATLAVFIRDLKEIVGITLQLWFWFTPIVYVKDILPDTLQKIMVYNPAYIFIESFQRLFVFQDLPMLRNLMLAALPVHVLVGGAYFVFRKLEKDVRDFL